jgi:hypothetical protein
MLMYTINQQISSTEVLEAISKGAPLKIKIDASSSYAGKVFWPPPAADWSLVLNPRNTQVFLWFKTRPRRDFEPKSFF